MTNRYLEKIASKFPGHKKGHGKLREIVEEELSERLVEKARHRKKKKHEKKADLADEFQPDLTPEQMHTLGVLIHPGSQYQDGQAKDNFFGVSAGLKEWPKEWLDKEAPIGWLQWYQGYANGKRTADDDRQIKRWKSFKARMTGVLKKQDPTLENMAIAPKARQSLLNWGVAPGLDIGKALETGSVGKYLEKVAISLVLAECPETKARRWFVNGEEVPAGWVVQKQIYKKFKK